MNVVNPWYQLGYVIPHLYTDMDAYQFYRIAPEGTVLITTGLNLTEYTLASVEHNLPTLWERFDLLAKKRSDRISLSGVPVASALGRKKMREILDEASQRTGVVCDTDLEAHIAAMKHLGVGKVALATRWPEAVNSALSRYLADAGIQAVACRSRARTLAENKMTLASEDHQLALDLGRQVLREAPDAEGLLMPGGLWFAIYAVPILEAEFGKPVFLNITSTTWAALHAAGPKVQIRPDPRWGRIMAAV
jgi:arylmalonate decarboxylase